MASNRGSKLLNYTTGIEPIKTAGEIMGLLVAKGAKSINMEYASGEITGLTFVIVVHGMDISFRLPCNYEGAERALRRTAPPRYRDKQQAKRVAWRILKDWIEAQLAIIECEQAEMAQVFMPYAITSTGQTLFQRFNDNPVLLTGVPERRLLNAPEEAVDGEVIDVPVC